MIITHNQVACRQEKWFTNATQFTPERWLQKNRRAEGQRIHPFLHLPFGYGARMCLGRRFAEMEIYILLIKVAICILYTMFSYSNEVCLEQSVFLPYYETFEGAHKKVQT